METVGYAEVAGFRAATAAQCDNGPRSCLGISPHYRRSFSHVIRQLTGGAIGVLVAQQTAANLHVKPGDTLTIERMGGSPVSVKVDGVIDLPSADSLFQAIGAVPGLAPQAPPDNVLLLPDQEWHTVFDPQTARLPDGVHLRSRKAHSWQSPRKSDRRPYLCNTAGEQPRGKVGWSGDSREKPWGKACRGALRRRVCSGSLSFFRSSRNDPGNASDAGHSGHREGTPAPGAGAPEGARRVNRKGAHFRIDGGAHHRRRRNHSGGWAELCSRLAADIDRHSPKQNQHAVGGRRA